MTLQIYTVCDEIHKTCASTCSGRSQEWHIPNTRPPPPILLFNFSFVYRSFWTPSFCTKLFGSMTCPRRIPTYRSHWWDSTFKFTLEFLFFGTHLFPLLEGSVTLTRLHSYSTPQSSLSLFRTHQSTTTRLRLLLNRSNSIQPSTSRTHMWILTPVDRLTSPCSNDRVDH